MGGLLTLYIAASVFGIGVTLLDLLGILGHSGGHGAGHDSGAQDSSGHDAGGHGAIEHDAGAHEAPAHETAPSSLLGHQPPQRPIGLRALTALRTVVYFSFGFGPMGWISHSMSGSLLASLAWSIPTGILFAGAGLVLRRIQRSTLDSQVSDGELLMEEAEVIVPIEPGLIGKVRVKALSVERFARAKEAAESYAVGEKVRVVSLADDLLVVSRE
jgi:hypothetical protein